MTRIDETRPQAVPYDHPETPIGTGTSSKPSATPHSAPTATAGEASLVTGHDSVKRTLERDPSQADRLIAQRLRGTSSTDREIVMRAVSQRGNTGIKKYADAEQVLRALKPFDKDQRADILASMKVGTRFSHALEDERAALKTPVQYESTSGSSAVAGLQKQAIANSRAQATKVTELSRHVMALSHAIGKVSRGAELMVGVGSSVGLVGGAAVAEREAFALRSSKPLKEVAHRAEASGALIWGELTDKIAAADRTTQKFLKLTGTYTDARNRYERAVLGNDFEGMTKYQKQMGAAANEMGRLASSLAEQAKSIAARHKDMDHATVETAITFVLSCVNLSGGSHAIHGLGEAAKDIGKDAVIERGAGEVVKRIGGH